MTVLCSGDVKGQQGRELGKICTAITYICICQFKIGSRFKTILKSESKLHNMPHGFSQDAVIYTPTLVQTKRANSLIGELKNNFVRFSL